MLCFIKFENINKFKKMIINKLDEDTKYNKFIQYLKIYIFKINPLIYNYDKLKI